MGLFDGFPFKSKEETEREKQEFQKRVFPLGMVQRDAAQRVLEELFQDPKRLREYLFAFIVSKDRYTMQDMTDEAMEDVQVQLKRQKWLKEDDKRLIVALLLLDCRATSLESYPTAQEVRQLAGELDEAL